MIADVIVGAGLAIGEESIQDIWDDEDDGSSYLSEYFGELKAFLEGAAERGEALIVYLN